MLEEDSSTLLEEDSSSLLEEDLASLEELAGAEDELDVADELDETDELEYSELLDSSSLLDEDVALLEYWELEDAVLLEYFSELLEYSVNEWPCGVLLLKGPVMVVSLEHAAIRAKTRNKATEKIFFIFFSSVRML